MLPYCVWSLTEPPLPWPPDGEAPFLLMVRCVVGQKFLALV